MEGISEMGKDNKWEESSCLKEMWNNLRREKWRGRYAIFSRPHYCDACMRKRYCRRLQVNSLLRKTILKGYECPDIDFFWERL